MESGEESSFVSTTDCNQSAESSGTFGNGPLSLSQVMKLFPCIGVPSGMGEDLFKMKDEALME